jgi:hypothetical protein
MKGTEQEKNILKEKITQWYTHCEEDYAISGRYIDSFYSPQNDTLTIIFEESQTLRYAIIESATFYRIDEIYNIRASPECVWKHMI